MKFRDVFLIAILLLATAAETRAQELIKPFGDIAWDDSFTSITQKVLSLPGLERCDASCLLRKLDISKLKSSKNISELPIDLMNGSGLLVKSETYFEVRSGRQFQYANGPHQIYISVYPVMIAEVPFTLSAEFGLNPGLLLVKPSNAILEKDGTLIPIALKSVGLSSTSKALALKRDAISSIISTKYFGGKPLGFSSRRDSLGSELVIGPSGERYSIDYHSGYFKMLSQRFSAFKAEEAVRLGRGKPDQSSKL